MIYLINNGNLPWSDLHKKFQGKKYEFKNLVKERLKVEYIKDLFDICPKPIKKFL